MLRTQVGREIARARVQMRLSQRALARRAGISPEALRAIERGEADPRTGTVEAVAAAMGISAAALIGWSGHGAEDVVTMFQALREPEREAVRLFCRFLVRERLDRLFRPTSPPGGDGQRGARRLRVGRRRGV
jgi:transcriptional regulator with XRE-family HTH domain